MKSFSIEEAYLWAQRFFAREWRLLLPVAFAFIAFPPLLFDFLVPASASATLSAAVQTNNAVLALSVIRWLLPLMLIFYLLGSIGGLTITALALAPGISVQEALLLALRRLAVLVGSQLLLIAAAMAVAILLGMSRLAPLGVQAFLFGLVIGLSIFVGVRLVLLMPMIVHRHIGPISAIRESWIMTAGTFWRLFATIIFYLLGAFIVMLALSSAVGSVLLLLGKAIGASELGVALNAVFVRALVAVATLGLNLLGVGIFRQLDGAIKGS
ncbi:glycerophosphoryl diester phosphodiesterase membrane domain-containing protein [Sphingomonas crusticola]|uniref:glycerophosphoryl diester phosphodiesterase membrane domain-containing protein n=1 Tax=Sphingomonas crusticola TaxID=1697973 RepID=UPI0013C3666B|nr:glycerophosphoryl diester phosphodiesterase membrane domain-containing protein [Sphingomonas crusticola]